MRTDARPHRAPEIAIRALLQARCELAQGPGLGCDGSTIWLPKAPPPLRLLLAVQAWEVASSPFAAPPMATGSWAEVLVNLLVAGRLRDRYPGLAASYDQMEDDWLQAVMNRPAAQPTLGELILARLLGRPVADRVRQADIGAQGRLAESVGRAWLTRPGQPTPDLGMPAPLGLPYQARCRRADAPAARHAVSPVPDWSSQATLRLPGPGPGRIVVSLPRPASGDSSPGPGVEADGLRREPSGSPPQPACWHDEWDSQVGAYRRDWCAVYETEVAVTATPTPPIGLAGAASRKVRRAFERNVLSRRLRSRELDGAELDLEAVVAAWAESGGSGLGRDRLFMSPHRFQGEAAVVVLADLSQSTSGWTLDLERAALVLLGDALEAVGDGFAFFGFRSRSRLECELVRIKAFGDPLGERVLSRVASLQARGYTRIAASLRHVTELLGATGAARQILLLVTDGMPYDVGGYGGSYAVEDTRRAWIEARARGIRPYCLTVDFAANQYLPRMCGPASWTVVNRRERLPEALLTLYRRARL
ncbi:MAG: VWA domain-containing protein [Candidatus Dormibacteria bacterium]